MPGVLRTLRATEQVALGVASGRMAGVLFIACGLDTFVTVLLPTPPGFHHPGVLAVAVAAVVAGLIVMWLPWQLLPERARLLVAPAAFGLIALHNIVAGLDPYRYGMFFFVVFIWLGLHERRGSSLLMAPLVTIAYIAPIAYDGASSADIASLSYAIPLYVTVGEVLAWRSERLRRLQERMRDLAENDPLTGLSNRAVYTEALREAGAGSGEIAVIFLDLDGFKQVNDVHGHQAGDQVLIDVATAMRDCVRPGTDDLPCRLAGDEFVILVSGPGAGAAAERIAARLHTALGRLRAAGGAPVTASIGVACGPGAEAERVAHAADEAMYAAKRAGHDRKVA